MQIALYQPDIPQNVGSILRLCACMGVPCHIIEPWGFVLDDKRMKRVAMDYAQRLNCAGAPPGIASMKPCTHKAFASYCLPLKPRSTTATSSIRAMMYCS